MIVYGKNPVIEALRSGKEVEKVLVAHDGHPPYQVLKLCKERGIKLQKVPRQKIEEMAGTKKTQGVLALLSPVEYVAPEELFHETLEKGSFFLVLDHLTDPQNVGNLLRTCEVLGGVGALLPKDRACPINQTVVKASAGAVFYLMLSKVSSLSRSLRAFKEMGGWVVVVERGGKSLQEFSFPRGCGLVLGSEGEGVSRSLLEMADAVVSIPMQGKVNSLNVSSAGAIAMWQASSQLNG
ncbi:MAG: 23S rRNA (guanosine(2251)-2'-O)-methyltransferase RlmB [Aquificaceae bacterium]|nr:23S rRNA (guanosine(2251)-2'-O)-methyltransferase RlmB [Aquificaceae bacterium]MCX8060368.1 23S rRNA (guanosine(2251)-2'-O)-methyltransferase RlmB [Aquificaceae bacterium]MDW8096794.1 23S rRNA (guanosine(2251)-2'-O)-methyltransferase RlmB [Aquificaceae bacterium]